MASSVWNLGVAAGKQNFTGTKQKRVERFHLKLQVVSLPQDLSIFGSKARHILAITKQLMVLVALST